MALTESEAIVLRTYPLREADLLVTLFTRAEGKVRGVARLAGFLPELTECIVCGRSLNGSRAYFHALADGLMCPDDKRLASSELSNESRALGAQMFRAPVESFAEKRWPKSQGADLRKFLIQILQRHLEKKLVTAGMLEKGGF